MQARLEITRSTAFPILVVFVLALTLLLGATIGYVLKPATTVSGPTHYLVAPAGNPTVAPCIYVDGRRAC